MIDLKCDCPQECDCASPERTPVSPYCKVHNTHPLPWTDCPLHGFKVLPIRSEPTVESLQQQLHDECLAHAAQIDTLAKELNAIHVTCRCVNWLGGCSYEWDCPLGHVREAKKIADPAPHAALLEEITGMRKKLNERI